MFRPPSQIQQRCGVQISVTPLEWSRDRLPGSPPSVIVVVLDPSLDLPRPRRGLSTTTESHLSTTDGLRSFVPPRPLFVGGGRNRTEVHEGEVPRPSVPQYLRKTSSHRTPFPVSSFRPSHPDAQVCLPQVERGVDNTRLSTGGFRYPTSEFGVVETYTDLNLYPRISPLV